MTYSTSDAKEWKKKWAGFSIGQQPVGELKK